MILDGTHGTVEGHGRQGIAILERMRLDVDRPALRDQRQGFQTVPGRIVPQRPVSGDGDVIAVPLPGETLVDPVRTVRLQVQDGQSR